MSTEAREVPHLHDLPQCTLPRSIWVLAFTVGLLLTSGGPVAAIDLKQFVMPGPVIAGHADIEKDCARCHRPFDTKGQAELCVSCHKPVGSDRESGRGLHGSLPAAREARCRDCHTEHRGRDADITGLDRETFSHTQTAFALEGAHRRAPCEGCHHLGRPTTISGAKQAPTADPKQKVGDEKPAVAAAIHRETYRDAPSKCYSCHRENDRHKGRLGKDCARCHTPVRWSESRFDHSKTKFALEGAHAKAACKLCHPGERYEKTPRECAACHRLDDVHRGNLGADCQRCHDVHGWKKARFDHSKTRFPLRGQHRKATCKSCHQDAANPKKVGRSCITCHGPDDDHDGRFGELCDHCHGTERWKKTTFDHRRDAKYALQGAHARLSCHSCHSLSQARAKPKTKVLSKVLPKARVPKARVEKRRCVDCHRSDDVHRGKEGKDCSRCHGQRAWARDIAFDHDVTRFPLLGLHALASCEDCHRDRRFRLTPTDCLACHRKQDVHDRRLGTKCALCHNPNDWKVWRFDHDRQTHFALHGAHEGIDCRSCHREPMDEKVRMSTTCVACHALDDAHRGRFGTRCDHCHAEKSWKERLPGR